MSQPYVTQFVDRHGTMRTRFRRAGFSAYLPSVGAPDFEQEYQKLLRDAPPAPIRSPDSAVGALRRELRRHGMPEAGEFVYFVATRGMIKIGFSSAIAARIRQLAAQSPSPLRLLAVAPGDRSTERRLHVRFAANQIKGEWFRSTPELKAVVAAVRKGGTFANIV